MRPAKVHVTDEALIDFVPATSNLGSAFAPRCGGSSFNVAKAAARQGADVDFIGALSTDLFGDRLAMDLAASCVGLANVPRVSHPSTLAFLEFHGTEPRYAFFNDGSATQMMDQSATRIVPEPGDILHVGSFSLVSDPGGAGIVTFARQAAAGLLLSVDPNARPAMIPDVAEWRARINTLIDLAGIVKLSDEDLALLSPGVTPEQMLTHLIGRSVPFAMVTLGPKGAMVATQSARATVPAIPGLVVDTLGCGDTVTGTLLAALAGRGREEIAGMDGSELERLTTRAMAAAALNARETGCQPPETWAIDALLAQF